MSTTLKYYYFPSACSLACHALLLDSGVPFSAETANLRDPATAATYRATVNPKGKVPALVLEDGQVLTEGIAIATAISQRATPSGKHYFGTTPEDVARAYEWLSFGSAEVQGKAFSPIFRPEFFAGPEAGEEVKGEVKKQAFKNVRAAFEVIDGKLEGKERVFEGVELSVVEAYLMVYWRWAKAFQIDVEGLENYARLAERVTALPTWKLLAEKEGW